MMGRGREVEIEIEYRDREIRAMNGILKNAEMFISV